jgi:hypothetical protein
MDLKLDLLASATNLYSSGGLFGIGVPDLILGGESVDKAGDLAVKIKSGGIRVGMEKAIGSKLKLKTDLSYLKLLFEGDVKTWNSWFFGMVRKLDSEYTLPIDSADVLAGGLGVQYVLNKNCELNYSFNQLIPLAVTKKEAGGTNVDVHAEASSGSVISGGNTQTFAVAWHF